MIPRTRLALSATALTLAAGTALATTGTAAAASDYPGVSSAEGSLTAGSYSPFDDDLGGEGGYFDPVKASETVLVAALTAGGVYAAWPQLTDLAAGYGITLPERPALP
jgi:hypothetical protein